MKVSAVFAAAIMLLFMAGIASAESDMAVGGGSAQARLDFQVSIPTILYLRVGSSGATVDVISFDVSDVPGSGEVQGSSSGANPVPVVARGFVPSGSTMTLVADSSTALQDSGKANIPFSEIRWDATGDFSSGRFNDTANQQLDQFTGSGSRSGTYTFYYDNDTYYPASTYTGSVTYTLCSP